MAYPTIPFLERVGEPLKGLLGRFVSGLTGFLKTEHKDDGSHGWDWKTPTFNAADYTGSGTLVWTVASTNVTTFAYRMVGKTMEVAIVLQVTTVAGVGAVLQIAIPGGFTAAKTMRNACEAIDNAVRTTARIGVAANGRQLLIQRTDAANWAASAAATAVSAQLSFEVQ